MDGVQVRSFARARRRLESTSAPVTNAHRMGAGAGRRRDGVVWMGTPGNWGILPGLIRYTPEDGWEQIAGPRCRRRTWRSMGSLSVPDGVAWALGSDILPEGTATSPDEPWTPRPGGSPD